MAKGKKSTKPVASSNWKKLLPTIAPADSKKKRKAADDFEISPNFKCWDKRQRIEKMKASHIAKKTVTTTTTTTTTKETIPDKDELWFGEDVDEDDLKNVYAHKETPQEQKLKKKSLVAKMNAVTGDQARLGKYVAIDCEMVGVGPEGTDSALARVSLVNFHGAVLLDIYVKPQEKVTDYRTHVSGIEAKHLESEEALSFKDAQFKAEAIIRGRILVGHAVYNDLQALMISHPALLIRDTSRYKPFRKLAKGRTPGLKMLVNEVLGISIQSGSHSSVEDARFTMQLYKSVKLEWEKSFGAKSGLILKKFSAKEEQNSSKKKVSIKEVAEDSESNSQSDSNSDSDSEDDASDDEE
ncbi:exonuclease [Mucor mucedo]|uniref:exonuclease n=1 Tax=Mucor mucedo TaxID=29922 RepID=UPI00222090B9|nr:exonuclease [Mucor mucedo]KAI7873460.1 exonuclease [Mucor mucedo]